MIEVADVAVAQPPPAALDETVDKHATPTPDSTAGDAWRVLAEEVVAGSLVDGRPVENVGAAKEFLCAESIQVMQVSAELCILLAISSLQSQI